MSIIWITYIIGSIVSARILAGAYAYSNGPKPEGGDWAFGWYLGVCGAGLWPLLAVAWMLTKVPLAIGKERQYRLKDKHDKKKRELEETKAQLRRLEREVGIPHWEMEEVN
jgi:hypothetical protein